jgi:hypothetical protein
MDDFGYIVVGFEDKSEGAGEFSLHQFEDLIGNRLGKLGKRA